MYGHSDFYRMVTGAFPELQAELDEYPELLHVQMGAFARLRNRPKVAASGPRINGASRLQMACGGHPTPPC